MATGWKTSTGSIALKVMSTKSLKTHFLIMLFRLLGGHKQGMIELNRDGAVQ